MNRHVVAIALCIATLPSLAQEIVPVELPGTPGRQARMLTPKPPQADGKYEIDLLLVYTAPAVSSLGGMDAARSDAAARVAQANVYFDNSLLPIRYRLLAVEPYPEAEEPSTPAQLAGIASVQTLRDRYGADLVSVLRSSTTTACGQAATFNGGVLTREPVPQNVDPERDAWSVVFCLDGRTFAHELGHNLGAGHDYTFSGQTNPVNDQPIPVYELAIGRGYWRSYAHGWRCGKGDLPGARYCDLMHYCRTPDAMYEDLLGDFFSNTQLIRDGEPCGSDGPVEAQQADNARSMLEAAPYVAAYREPVEQKNESASFGGAWSAWALLLALGFRRAWRTNGRAEPL